jgi:hypothetical protein
MWVIELKPMMDAEGILISWLIPASEAFTVLLKNLALTEHIIFKHGCIQLCDYMPMSTKL